MNYLLTLMSLKIHISDFVELKDLWILPDGSQNMMFTLVLLWTMKVNGVGKKDIKNKTGLLFMYCS